MCRYAVQLASVFNCVVVWELLGVVEHQWEVNDLATVPFTRLHPRKKHTGVGLEPELGPRHAEPSRSDALGHVAQRPQSLFLPLLLRLLLSCMLLCPRLPSLHARADLASCCERLLAPKGGWQAPECEWEGGKPRNGKGSHGMLNGGVRFTHGLGASTFTVRNHQAKQQRTSNDNNESE